MTTGRQELQYSGSHSKRAEWGPAWLYSSTTESPQPQELSLVTADSAATSAAPSGVLPIADQIPDTRVNPSVAGADFFAYSEGCWTEIFAHDYGYLTGPRSYP